MIGIFDSGLGGLSIYKGIKELMPERKVIYLADQLNFPYGTKGKKRLLELARKNTSFLLNKGAKVIIVACNTATVNTIDKLREEFQNPFIGVAPEVEKASRESKKGKVAILATPMTHKSKYQKKQIANKCGAILIYPSDGSSLINKIEKSEDITNEDLVSALGSAIEKGVDTVVLGCTHFHFISERFEYLFPEIKFIGSLKAISSSIKILFENQGLKLDKGKDVFYTTGEAEPFENFLSENLGIKKGNVQKIDTKQNANK